MKYVVVVDNRGEESAIVFPEFVNHNTICNRNGPILSAGFCAYGNLTKKWNAFGESITLRMKSRPQDSKLIEEFFLLAKDADEDFKA